jgi:hypothetical protein
MEYNITCNWFSENRDVVTIFIKCIAVRKLSKLQRSSYKLAGSRVNFFLPTKQAIAKHKRNESLLYSYNLHAVISHFFFL